MTASFWIVAALTCAAPGTAEDKTAPKPATSKIASVTVYQGQALVTRDVNVPEGEGTVEVVVTPLPPQVMEGSLFAEGTDGLRVLSTRFRSRAVKDDTRQEVRSKEDLIKTLELENEKILKDVNVQTQDLKYLEKLEGFTGTSLNALTEKGRLDSEAILTLTRFVMETRGDKSKSEVDLRQKLQANAEAIAFARRQLVELSAGSSRIERDALIIVQKARREAGKVRLGYLVNAANWSPQYRLRGGDDKTPVKLEYLAAVVQQTGESWNDVRVTLSTARPSLDSAPPDLLPLKMAIAGGRDRGPVDVSDNRSQKLLNELEKRLTMSFPNQTPFEDVIKYIRSNTVGTAFPDGIPIYIDPIGLQEAEKTVTSPVTLDLADVPIKTSLKLILKQLSLRYQVTDGLLKIISLSDDNDLPEAEELAGGAGMAGMGRMFGGMGGGMGGMGGMMSLESAQASDAGLINRAAVADQAEELRIIDGPGGEIAKSEKDGPVVSFPIAGLLDIPSRRDPQLLEVARTDLPAEYYAKAQPVLAPRVYRLAKLTNKADFVLLPGEATVYVGSDFVGRMRLPLVAAGEPFVAGFGVDPQLQVSRRLMKKSRTVQGGNQVFTYEFRLSLRNYRAEAIKVQLWDRLPRPQGESVVVNLVKTSAELSTDPLYTRASKMDNLLRWDLDVPAGTVGDKTMYLNYEFRLEYARDLPPPKFLSGGLREAPIGGSAMGGMGGMSGGFRSVKPD